MQNNSKWAETILVALALIVGLASYADPLRLGEEELLADAVRDLTTSNSKTLAAAAKAPQEALFTTSRARIKPNRINQNPHTAATQRLSATGITSDRVDPAIGTEYLPLGTAKINGKSVAVYVFDNGAKLDDEAGQGEGFADVFDGAGHLLRRLIFRGHRKSPPQILEFVYKTAR